MLKKIGECSVDSGQILIADPCYVLREDDRVFPSFGDFCSTLKKENFPSFRSFDGLGVVVSSGYGDGGYPVEADIVEGVVHSVKITFVNKKEDQETIKMMKTFFANEVAKEPQSREFSIKDIQTEIERLENS